MATRTLLVILGALALSAPRLTAQMADSTCSVARCGYAVLPTLSGLNVVQGSAERRVASLPFLWPKELHAAFGADSLALSHARRATRLRAFGAFVSSTGITMIALGAITGIGPGGSFRSSAILALAGTGVVATSIPVHFAADAELSRAVWLYNARIESRARNLKPVAE